MIKSKVFRWGDYPGLSEWVPCNHQDLYYERKTEGSEAIDGSRSQNDATAGF